MGLDRPDATHQGEHGSIDRLHGRTDVVDVVTATPGFQG